ncbi:MAG: HEAT repeat domain-containing protein [Bdellovibrionales bacterium]|nr:HEAT repeat domain-containing protein [Bdellovibrionales bacterium]
MRKAKSSSKPISRKCLSLKLAAVALVCGLSSAFAAIPAKPIGAKTSVEAMIRSDLVSFRKEKRADFQSLVKKWERVYGSRSAPTLLAIAEDKKSPNTDRYVALLAHTRIRGPHDAKELVALLDDRDWMVRSAALKSIEILGYAPAGAKVLDKLANDRALVIRLQSIETLEKLRPPGTPDALLKAAMDGKNYRPGNFRKGRADWVPQRALAALRELRPLGYAPRLLPLMNESKDGRIRAHALHTIEILESKSLKQGRPFRERAAAWTATLQASR